VRVLSVHRSRGPRAKTIRPAERYLTAGAAEARRLGCSFVGGEHVLLALIRDRTSPTRALLARFGVDPGGVETLLTSSLTPDPVRAKIDPEALARLGIDLDAVRARIEETFGPGALERSGASCLGIAPRLKLAFAYALDEAGERPLRDEQVLLGMLRVPDSAASRLLSRVGVAAEDMRTLRPEAPR
jgi:ATP-dependent Clp protease ATP-binding subunit ClpA